MLFTSIRFKIILWYMVLLSTALLVFSELAYHYYHSSIYKNLDNLLNSRAVGIVQSVDTYWETERQQALEMGANIRDFGKAENVNFAKITRHWLETRSADDPQFMNVSIQIFDKQGQCLVSSLDIPNLLNLSVETLVGVRRGAHHYENIEGELAHEKPVAFRALTMPVYENKKIAYIVRVAIPLQETNTGLHRLKVILFGLLPLIVVLTGVAGAILARISLAPLNHLIHSVRQMSFDNLKIRLNIPRSNDEIQILAEAFNAMISRLEKVFSSQQQFIQDVSHEIKTPLTVLRGTMETALKKVRSPQRYEAILKSSLEETQRINQIVESLVVLARFDNQEIAPQIRPVDLTGLLADILGEMQILAEIKNIHLEYSPNGKIDLPADASQIRTLFLNLIDNAIKYTQPDGKITVSLERRDADALVKVRDTGIGIAPEYVSLIFDRFYRVDKSRGREGFGLGLSMVKSIIETHKGKIEVESVPGAGTTFFVFLPLSLTGS